MPPHGELRNPPRSSADTWGHSMYPDEHSEDDSRRRSRAPFVPSESWIDAFDAQCTEPMLKGLRRYAASWARLLSKDYGNDYAEEIVQNALTDTMRGVLRWDPLADNLGPYLEAVIRLRARRDRKRARRNEHVSIDALDPDDPSSGITDVEASLAVSTSARTIESAEAARTETMTQLRALAVDDPLALRFLDAMEHDVITRAQIMRFAGLTRAEYHNTRRRLARLRTQLETRQTSSAKEDWPCCATVTASRVNRPTRWRLFSKHVSAESSAIDTVSWREPHGLDDSDRRPLATRSWLARSA